MTLPAPRRGRILLTVAAAAAALCAGSLPATAQQPPAGGAGTASPAAAPAAPKAAKGDATSGEASKKAATSYSLGVFWGSQLRSTGVAPDAINSARVGQGIHDALTGKATLSDQDRDNVRVLAASGVESNHHAAEKFLAENGKKPGVVTTASGLEYQELKAGSGASPKASDTVSVNYRGTLLDGTEFDSTAKHGGQPASFEVDHVIPGWTEALQLMKPGAKWKLFIPPRLAYDLRGPPSIPPGSMLIFDVELVGVTAAPPAPAAPAPVPQSALPKPTGKAPVNPAGNPNSPPPASMAPASK